MSLKTHRFINYRKRTFTKNPKHNSAQPFSLYQEYFLLFTYRLYTKQNGWNIKQLKNIKIRNAVEYGKKYWYENLHSSYYLKEKEFVFVMRGKTYKFKYLNSEQIFHGNIEQLKTTNNLDVTVIKISHFWISGLNIISNKIDKKSKSSLIENFEDKTKDNEDIYMIVKSSNLGLCIENVSKLKIKDLNYHPYLKIPVYYWTLDQYYLILQFIPRSVPWKIEVWGSWYTALKNKKLINFLFEAKEACVTLEHYEIRLLKSTFTENFEFSDLKFKVKSKYSYYEKIMTISEVDIFRKKMYH